MKGNQPTLSKQRKRLPRAQIPVGDHNRDRGHGRREARTIKAVTLHTPAGIGGLDDYQVRRYDAWYRYITLAMWAHAFLAVTAAASKGAANPSGTNSSLSPSARSDVSWHT